MDYIIYSLWPTLIFDKNVAEILRTSLESSFMLTTMAQSSASNFIHIPSATFSSKSIPSDQLWFIGPLLAVHFSFASRVDIASYPGPRVERGRGPGDTWQNSRMCSVSIIA